MAVSKKAIRKIAKQVVKDGYTDKEAAEWEVRTRCLKLKIAYDGEIIAWCIDREINSHLYKRTPEGYGWS